MRVYAVQAKDSEWCIPVAAATAKRAKKLAPQSELWGELMDEVECIGWGNPLWWVTVRWCPDYTVEGSERIIPDQEAYGIGFWEEEKRW